MAVTQELMNKFLLMSEDGRKELRLRGNDLLPRVNFRVKDEDIQGICDFVEKHGVGSLDLCYNRITDEGIFVLKLRHELDHLNLMCNDIKSDGVKFLCDAGPGLKVKSLRLTGNKFGPEGGKYLATLLESNGYLEHLDIGETDQDIESIVYLAAALRNTDAILHSLELSRPLLMFSQSHAAEVLGQMLSMNIHLHELILKKFGFGDHDVELLSLGLQKKVEEKFIIPKEEHAIWIDKETSSCSTETVSLSDYLKYDEGNLKEEQLRDQEVNMENETVTESIVEENTSTRSIKNPLQRIIAKDEFVSYLRHLDLSCNSLADDSIDYLSPYLLSGPPLLILNISHNMIHDTGAIELSKCIPSTKLEVLDIGYNRISNIGLRNVAFQLKRICPLQRIYIWGNQLNEEICKFLQEIISSGNILQDNIDVMPYVVDGMYYAAYNHASDNRQNYYYCVPECPLYKANKL